MKLLFSLECLDMTNLEGKLQLFGLTSVWLCLLSSNHCDFSKPDSVSSARYLLLVGFALILCQTWARALTEKSRMHVELPHGLPPLFRDRDLPSLLCGLFYCPQRDVCMFCAACGVERLTSYKRVLDKHHSCYVPWKEHHFYLSCRIFAAPFLCLDTQTCRCAAGARVLSAVAVHDRPGSRRLSHAASGVAAASPGVSESLWVSHSSEVGSRCISQNLSPSLSDPLIVVIFSYSPFFMNMSVQHSTWRIWSRKAVLSFSQGSFIFNQWRYL